MPGALRERSGSELVFGVLRALMVSYRLWGSASGLARAQLSDALQVTALQIDRALDYLAHEGLVALDQDAGTVRLSEDGVRALLVNSSPLVRRTVAFPGATWH